MQNWFGGQPLARFLGELMTPAVTNAYQKVYSLLSETMIADLYSDTPLAISPHPLLIKNNRPFKKVCF
jgi:hypothetical protein